MSSFLYFLLILAIEVFSIILSVSLVVFVFWLGIELITLVMSVVKKVDDDSHYLP